MKHSTMKNYKTGLFLLGLMMSVVIWSCHNASTDPKPTESYTKFIISFDFNKVPSLNFDTTAAIGVVSEETRSVTLSVPFGADLTALVPTIKLSEKTSISPESGIPQDFSKPVKYTVTSEDGSKKIYTASVKPNTTVDFWLDAPKDTIFLAPDESVDLGAYLKLTGGNFRNVSSDKLVLTSQTSAKQYTFPVFSSTSSQLVFKMPTDLPKDPYSYSLYVGNQFIMPHMKNPNGQLLSVLSIIKFPRVTSVTSNIKHQTNITIAGTNLGAVNNVTFTGGTSISQGSFVSQSETSIVVTLPATAAPGKLTLTTSAGYKIDTNPIAIILPAGTNVAPGTAKPGIDDITITGTNLDLIASISLLGVKDPIPATAFKSQSTTKIVLGLPGGATGGGVNYKTTLGYSGNLGVTVVVGSGPPPLAIYLYDETTAPGGGDWSWSQTVSDRSNTEQVHSGNVSWKYSSSSGGGLSEGGITAINVSSMTYFSFSIYGAPGSNGLQVACILNDNWSDYHSVTLVAGQWTEYKVALSAYTLIDKTKIVRFALKPETGSAVTIYADRVGFE